MNITSHRNTSVLKLNNLELDKNLNILKEYISSSKNKEVVVDISHMNLLDACKISVLCSTNLYLEFPQWKINWLVASPIIEKMINPMGLGNSAIICK